MTSTCRICLGLATRKSPLFEPCKYTGAQGYVHEDCLSDHLSGVKDPKCNKCQASIVFASLMDTQPFTSNHYKTYLEYAIESAIFMSIGDFSGFIAVSVCVIVIVGLFLVCVGITADEINMALRYIVLIDGVEDFDSIMSKRLEFIRPFFSTVGSGWNIILFGLTASHIAQVVFTLQTKRSQLRAKEETTKETTATKETKTKANLGASQTLTFRKTPQTLTLALRRLRLKCLINLPKLKIALLLSVLSLLFSVPVLFPLFTGVKWRWMLPPMHFVMRKTYPRKLVNYRDQHTIRKFVRYTAIMKNRCKLLAEHHSFPCKCTACPRLLHHSSPITTHHLLPHITYYHQSITVTIVVILCYGLHLRELSHW